MASLEEHLFQFKVEMDRDTEFLRRQRWKVVPNFKLVVNGYTCTQVWEHPLTGERFPHWPSFMKCRRAIDVANDEYLSELRWKEIRVRVHHKNEETPPTEASFYVHPETKKIFPKDVAVRIARDYYNDEEIMCLLTNRLNDLLKGKRLKEGDLICLDYDNHIYELWD